MKVAIFASEYAPYNITGTFRTLKFVRELRRAGDEVYMITLTEEAALLRFGKQREDTSLIDELEQPYIKRTIGLRLFNDFFGFFPFNRKNSINISDLCSLVQEICPDIIMATYPHSSTIKIASLVSMRLKIPLVLDMRDLWLPWSIAPYKNRLYYYLTKLWERKLFRQASAILVVTPPMRNIFVRHHGEGILDKITVVPNGYESDVFLRDQLESKPISEKGKVRIGYVGSFYYNPAVREEALTPWYKRKGSAKLHYYAVKEDWKYRSPYFFLVAVKGLVNKYPELKEKIEIEFVGEQQSWLPEMIRELGLEELCTITGFIAREQLSRKYDEFDYLLATSEKMPDGMPHYCLPSKLFDYVKISKPVIGFLTEGIQKEFVEKAGIGFVIDPDKPDEAVGSLYSVINSRHRLNIDKAYLEGYSIRTLTGILRKVFEQHLAPGVS